MSGNPLKEPELKNFGIALTLVEKPVLPQTEENLF
jgi:hypothetical protein